MKLLLINPNTSDGFTAIAQKAADAFKNADTIVKAVSSPCGPLTLEGYFDEIISSVGVLEMIQKEKENYDGFIVACFSNHFSIYAARQLTDKPVVGIFEPPMLLAKQLGARFSIVTPSPRWKPLLEEGLEAVRMQGDCTGWSACQRTNWKKNFWKNPGGRSQRTVRRSLSSGAAAWQGSIQG